MNMYLKMTFIIEEYGTRIKTVMKPEQTINIKIQDLPTNGKVDCMLHYFLIAEINGIRQEWLIADYYYNDYDIYIKDIESLQDVDTLQLYADTDVYDDDDDDSRIEDCGVKIEVKSHRTTTDTVEFWVSPAVIRPADSPARL